MSRILRKKEERREEQPKKGDSLYKGPEVEKMTTRVETEVKKEGGKQYEVKLEGLGRQE